jgi:hypothetical protein
LTVIVVSFFESVVRDHSKDHPMTVAYLSATRSPGSVHHSAGRNSTVEDLVCWALATFFAQAVSVATETFVFLVWQVATTDQVPSCFALVGAGQHKVDSSGKA